MLKAAGFLLLISRPSPDRNTTVQRPGRCEHKPTRSSARSAHIIGVKTDSVDELVRDGIVGEDDTRLCADPHLTYRASILHCSLLDELLAKQAVAVRKGEWPSG